MIPVMIFLKLGMKSFVFNIVTFIICFAVYEMIHILRVLINDLKKEIKKYTLNKK